MGKKISQVPKAPKQIQALVVREIALTERQSGIISALTPTQHVKVKPGRGGKKVTYVEGGYVIAKLNEAFSPLGWDFEVVDQGQSERKTESNAEGEVWVRGKLTIIDHKNGYRVFKTQYGQHPIHKNVPIGDAFKAAATDAMKKCASLFGIALDVYWSQDEKTGDTKAPAKMSVADMFERAKTMINATRDTGGLIEYDQKLKDSKNFTKAQQDELHKLIQARVDNLDVESNK